MPVRTLIFLRFKAIYRSKSWFSWGFEQNPGETRSMLAKSYLIIDSQHCKISVEILVKSKIFLCFKSNIPVKTLICFWVQNNIPVKTLIFLRFKAICWWKLWFSLGLKQYTGQTLDSPEVSSKSPVKPGQCWQRIISYNC